MADRFQNGSAVEGKLTQEAEAQQINHRQAAGQGGAENEFFQAGVVLLLFGFHEFGRFEVLFRFLVTSLNSHKF